MFTWSKVRFLVAFAVVSAMVFVVAGCGKQGVQTPGANEPYKIGAVIDISGNASSLGIPERNTLQMLVEQVNNAGGINGHPIDLKILDNKSDSTEAVLAIKNLVEQEKVLAVLGASTSGPSMSMKDTAQKNEVPMVSLAAASSIVEPVAERKWIFKTAQSDIIVANKIAAYLKEKNINKVAFLYMNNAYGDGGRMAMEKAAPAQGIQIAVLEKFEADDKDMTAQLTKVKSSDVQAAIVWAIPPSASIITRNYRQMDIKIPLIQTHGVGNQKFLEIAGDAANGVVLPVGKLLVAEQLPDTDSQKKVLLEYKNSYKARFNEDPSTFGGHGWDGFQLVVNALAKAGPDRAKIRDELEKTTGFVGISGVFNMSAADHNGLAESALVMVEVKDGKWQLIK